LQREVLYGFINAVFEKILKEQLSILASIENFPHAADTSKSNFYDGEKEERFAFLKQVVNALLTVRLYTRSQDPIQAPKRNTAPALEKPFEEEEDVEEGSTNPGGYASSLEAARAAAVAAKKKFKKKRRRVPDSTAPPLAQPAGFPHMYGNRNTEFMSQVGQEEDRMILPTPIFSPGEHPVIPNMGQAAVIKPTSNLHKLAALVGRSAKK
jgi:hypothetical protein